MAELWKALFTKWKNKRYMVNNKIPNELRPKVIAFLEAVDIYFSFLKDYEYYDIEQRVATQYVVKNVTEVLYKNEKLDRAIVIHYEPNNFEGKPIDLVSISIFDGIKFMIKELELELYIKKYKPEYEIEHLTYPNKNNKNTFKENMNTSVAGFAYFLKDTGMNLVNGSEWEDGLIFDWSSAEKILYKEQKRILGEDENKN